MDKTKLIKYACEHGMSCFNVHEMHLRLGEEYELNEL